MRPIRPALIALLLAALALPRPAGAGIAVCVGDCPPGDGRILVNELIIGVGIALQRRALTACPSFDANDDDAVTVSELIAAVNNAQRGCDGAPTPTRSAGPSATATTGDAPPTNTGTPTITPTPALGPTITFFGVTNADGSVQDATEPGTIPVYQRPFGLGFTLIVEARRNREGGPLTDATTFVPGDVPDLQIQVTRPLGNGSAAVCDNEVTNFGGVPGIDPPQLEDPAAIADQLNDLGCRFLDGVGDTLARPCGLGCVRFESGEFGCVSDPEGSLGTRQFCGQISGAIEFPAGDTLVSVRVRDQAGLLGPPAQLIVRIAP